VAVAILVALEAAREQGLDLPVTDALAPRWRDAIADGHGGEDVASVFAEASTNRVSDQTGDADG
jgi:3-hydroxyisobutyrate dehydrogenase-like beta-hydroxyacid dehydrogenase